MPSAPYQERLRALSDRLIQIQKPIQILDAIKWPAVIKHDFFNNKAKELPRIDSDFYVRQKIPFDIETVYQALLTLYHDVSRQIGSNDLLGAVLKDTISQYIRVLDLLKTRGTPEFLLQSQKLYGSSKDHLCGDSKSLVELGERLCSIFSLPGARHLNQHYTKTFNAEHAVEYLSQRLNAYFGPGVMQVIIDDGIVSDASAGGDKIKVNKHANFSELDLQVLEVHEGWVHVGTTLNGRSQPWATWLSIGSPRITATQEGLAVLMETLTFSSYPDRARRISDRVIAIDMAEQGADFLQVYNHFIDKGISQNESFTIAQRVFRGGMVEGGSCFTKDLSYVRGFIELVNFIRSSTLEGIPEILPMLFVGKVTLDDIPVLYHFYKEGLIKEPKYLPAMFRDLNGLYVWFGFASGIAQLDMKKVQSHFNKLFKELLQNSENR